MRESSVDRGAAAGRRPERGELLANCAIDFERWACVWNKGCSDERTRQVEQRFPQDECTSAPVPRPAEEEDEHEGHYEADSSTGGQPDNRLEATGAWGGVHHSVLEPQPTCQSPGQLEQQRLREDPMSLVAATAAAAAASSAETCTLWEQAPSLSTQGGSVPK